MKALFEMYLVRRLKTIRAFRLSGGNLCSTVLACHNLGGHLGWEKTGPRQGKLRKRHNGTVLERLTCFYLFLLLRLKRNE
jgi:hypothetical protein